MNNPHWRFYDAATGVVLPQMMVLPSPQSVIDNTPAGCVAVHADIDHLTQRFDVTQDPHVLVPYEPPPPPLEVAKAWRASAIDAAGDSASAAPIQFTTLAGVAQTYQADRDSKQAISQALVGYGLAGTTPDGFFWRSMDNTNVPFTLADVQGLFNAMVRRDAAGFAKRAALKDQISAAADVASVQSIVWS